MHLDNKLWEDMGNKFMYIVLVYTLGALTHNQHWDFVVELLHLYFGQKGVGSGVIWEVQII